VTPDPLVAESLPAAVQVTNRVARTFALAIRFLPAPLRHDVYLLYLVCRTLDDLADTAHPEARQRIEAVRHWAAGSGEAVGREAIILSHLVERYPAMPRQAVIDFCTGQLDELTGVRIETEDDLDLHAYRAAGTVGLLMAGVLGVSDGAADATARALGIAMQRTNILRDIDEDLARGRIYLPAKTMAKLGVRDLASDDRSQLLQVEIAIADSWYERGLAGIQYLLQGRRQVRAAGVMYREILRQLERDGLGRIRPQRVSVSTPRKLWLMTQMMISTADETIGSSVPAASRRRP
jgi:phytoene synthase